MPDFHNMTQDPKRPNDTASDTDVMNINHYTDYTTHDTLLTNMTTNKSQVYPINTHVIY